MFYGITHLILNSVGGTIRWVYGSIWRTIFKQPKYEYKEYLHGPKHSKDHWDQHQHFTNGIIGFIFLAVIIYKFV